VFDRPAVFTTQGVTPIVQAHPRPARVRRAHPSLRTRSAADQGLIADAAAAASLSPDLVEAVAWQESHLTPGLISPAGAVGEMQLMPATARALGVDPKISRQNYRGGAAYLGALMRYYKGDLVLALAAYNAGPGAVERFGGVPRYKETEAYVAAVLDRLGEDATKLTASGSGH
jgi:soluble lytic murein transglycosylase-like protein